MKKALISLFIMAFLSLALISCESECQHERFSSTEVEPTCVSEGYTVNECLDCGFKYKTDIVSPIEHTLSKETVAPTCTEQGYTLYSCECGYEYKSDFVSPLGHTTRKETYPPTCEKQGYTLSRCVSCDFESRSDFLPAKGHALTAEVTPPTCEAEGYTTYSCYCGYTYDSDFKVPTGHAFTSVITPPTSSRDGYTHHSCACGYEYRGDYIMSDSIFHGAYVSGTDILAYGIDISKWNGDINWAQIKAAGIDFVIIKAGSTNGKDPKFEVNYANAKAAGLGVGAYFYSYAKNIDGINAEVALFLEFLGGKQFDYPVYLDIEDPSQETLGEELLTEMCVTFIEKMQENGYFCGIYTNNNWLVNLLNSQTITQKFDLWLARWLNSGEPNWSASFGARTGIWQYTDEGRIGDHDCNFDMNVAFKDYPSLIKEWGYNGY